MRRKPIPPCIVYALINPITRDIFYVGCTQFRLRDRINGHIGLSKRRLTQKDILIDDIVKSGKRPIGKIFHKRKHPHFHRKTMNEKEIALIKKLYAEGHPLLNIKSLKRQYPNQ